MLCRTECSPCPSICPLPGLDTRNITGNFGISISSQSILLIEPLLDLEIDQKEKVAGKERNFTVHKSKLLFDTRPRPFLHHEYTRIGKKQYLKAMLELRLCLNAIFVRVRTSPRKLKIETYDWFYCARHPVMR